MNTLRYAWRSLSRSKGFVAVAVLALGLGLGLSTTMFAVMDAVINPFVPYRDPDGLYQVRWWFSVRDVHVAPGILYRTVHDQTRSYSAIVPMTGERLSLEEDEGRDRFAARVTPQFFQTTGVRPRLGRGFVESDGEDVVVLADDLWRRIFGRRTSLDGATITLGDKVYPVVGVMPRGSIVPVYASIWMPLPAVVLPTVSVTPLVRLKPGVTEAQANAELKSIGAVLTQQYATRERPIALELSPVRVRGEQLRDLHKAMVGAALSVLIIACVNLAHLMLARGLAKRREIALRLALGASRARVIWQMFAECAIVTAAGAALGAVGAIWGADVLTNRMPPEVSWVGMVQPQLSWRVFAMAALAAAASAVLFGLIPAIRVALAVSLDEPLKDGAGTTGRSRQRYSPLVVLEVALALVLMMGGGLLLRTIQQARGVEFSFDAKTLLQTQVGFRNRDSSAVMRRDEILTVLANIPGVRDVAFSGYRRTAGDAMTAEMVVGDSTRTIAGGPALVSWRYLRVHGLPMLKGRDFEPGDATGNGVAIIDAAAALRLYPDQEAVGRMIKLGAPARDAAWIRIVGVARSAITTSGGARIGGPSVWVAGPDGPARYGSFLIRTGRRDAKTTALVRRALRTLPGVWFTTVEDFDGDWTAGLRSQAFLANVFVSMGLVALALSALGLYGVLAYAVNQRMREFAVRLALGARPQQLFRLVLHDGFVMLLAGVGIGAFVALMASRLLDSVLTATVLPSDVIALVAAESVLILAGLAAALGPARRAVKADPLDILRAT